MADTGGWQGVVLPNAFGSPGDAIQARINNRNALTSRYGETLQRQQELDLRERELKRKQAEQYGLVNIKNLNENTDEQKLLLGDKYANDVTHQELQGVYNELISQVNTVDPVTFDYLLHSKTTEFNNWHNQFKQDFDYAQKKVDDILKTNTNLSPDQAKEIVRGQLDDKYFKLGDDGGITRKPPEEVDTRHDPTAILNDPRMQGNIAIGGQDVLKKYIQSQKLHQEDYGTYKSNKGFVNADDYNIGRSDLMEMTHNEHGEPVLKMKTEELNVGNGVKLKMLPKATYDEMMSVPEVASAINKLWNPVAAKIEENFAQQGNAIDPQSEEMLKRDFVRKTIEDNKLDLSFIQKKEKDVIPRPQTSFSFNFGAPNSASQGNEFTRIGSIDPVVLRSGAVISKGVVKDKEGKAYTGRASIKPSELPAGLKSIIKPVLDKLDTVAEYYDLEIEDGEIKAVRPSGGSWIDEQDLRNLQLQNNTEPLKGPQKTYGLPEGQKPQLKKTGKKTVPWANPQ